MFFLVEPLVVESKEKVEEKEEEKEEEIEHGKDGGKQDEVIDWKTDVPACFTLG